MRTFTDNAGRCWTVTLNVTALKRIRDLAGVNLLGVLEGGLLERLGSDPILLADVLYAAVKPEADAREVSDDDFGAALAGDCIEQATAALLEELVAFFPLARRRLLERVLEKLHAVQQAASRQASAKLEAMDIEQLLKTSSDSSGAVPDSSASIPAGGHGEVVIEGFVRVPQSYSGTRFRPTPNALTLTSDLSGSILIASSITGATFLYLPPWQPPSLLLARVASGGIHTLGTSGEPNPGSQPANSLYLTPAGSAPFILNTVVTGSNVTLSGPPDWSMCLVHWDGQTCRVVAAKVTYAVG